MKIVADKATNSLIITASKQDYEVVLSILRKIDIPRDQVFIKTVIMEMNASDADTFEVAYFKFDPIANQIVYRLKVSDASVTTPNMRWSLTSSFGPTQVFVTASVDETATSFEYGHITTLATGTQNQETLGAADFGEINGNEITIKLSLDKVNAPVGTRFV